MDKQLTWNGNEFVFSDKPNHGVMGIPNDQPDDFAEEVAKRYNAHKGLQERLEEIFSLVSYVNIHGVGEQPEPNGDPQPLRVDKEQFWQLFQRIGGLASWVTETGNQVNVRTPDGKRGEVGTNYYLYEQEACPTCGHEAEPLHIGKSSGGWCFSLHIGDGISTLQDWIDRWSEPGAVIKDEYDRSISAEKMLRTITGREREATWDKVPYGYASWEAFHAANQSQEGPNGLLRHRIDGRHCLGHGEGTYDFMGGEFC